MAPNVVDSVGRDPENAYNGAEFNKKAPLSTEVSEDNYKLNIFQSSLNLIAHVLIGMTVAVSLLYALRQGVPVEGTPQWITRQHVIICVLGYQLLMAEGILSLCPHNGWSQMLSLVDRRRAHWILQIAGSAMALAGCILKVFDKAVHWDTLHAQFALVSMVFTSVSLVNGLASLYAYELSKFYLPPSLSKLTHICFGIVGFVAASICLCYGFEKDMFRNWAGAEYTTAMYVIVASFTFIVIVNPFITLFTKGKAAFKRN